MELSKEEKEYLLANCRNMTVRQLETSLKSQNFCKQKGDLYIKIHGFLTKRKANFKRAKENLYYQNNITGRELEVLDLMSKGFTDENIAKSLFIALATTKTHINNIVQKLGLDGNPKHIIRVRVILWYLKNIKKLEIDYEE